MNEHQVPHAQRFSPSPSACTSLDDNNQGMLQPRQSDQTRGPTIEIHRDHSPTTHLQIGNSQIVMDFYIQSFLNIHPEASKAVCSSMINRIAPNKPNKNGTAPAWWPTGVRNVCPTRLRKKGLSPSVYASRWRLLLTKNRA